MSDGEGSLKQAARRGPEKGEEQKDVVESGKMKRRGAAKPKVVGHERVQEVGEKAHGAVCAGSWSVVWRRRGRGMFALGARVSVVVGVLDLFGGEVSVDLRGGERLVSEQLL